MIASVLVSFELAGCSERPEPTPSPKSVAKSSTRIEAFRAIKFAGEKVVVRFREGLPTAPVPESVAGSAPWPGDRVVLVGVGEGEVFLALDLDALKFYHSTPSADQLERFRQLGDDGRLFVVPSGSVATVARVVDGELPEGLKAVELGLPGPSGGMAWVSDTFVRQASDRPK